MSTSSPESSIGNSFRICDSVLDAIGETPLVRLNQVASHLDCQVLAKCEFFNAGSSVKDRIGKRMVQDAEDAGLITPGETTLIEPTSGNTGIGLALASACKGYKCIITMPEKMSKEKVDVLKALGAEIIRTPTEAAWDAPDSHISVAQRLQKELPNSFILNQYNNPSNPMAHYDGTAEELWRQSGGKIDMLVAGAGTGGTITGIAKRLKELNPEIIIVGVDPKGSILAEPEVLNEENRLQSYQVEGIGYDFIPQVLDRSLVDEWYKSDDKESLVMMRRLIRQEGLLCGGSSGAAVSAALKAAASLKKDQTCVVILPDSVRNYMTKALSDEWMVQHGFVDDLVIRPTEYQTWWSHLRVCDLPLSTPLTITSDVTCKDAITLLKKEGFDMVPVVEDNNVIGVVTEGNIHSRVLSGRAQPDATVADAGVIYKTFRKFTLNAPLADLARALDSEPYALVVTEQRCFGGSKGKGSKEEEGGTAPSVPTSPSPSRVTTRTVVSGIITRIDLLDFVSSGDPNQIVNGK